MLYTSPANVTCQENSTCTLFCYASSEERINYTWTKKGSLVTSDDAIIARNVIIITPRAEKSKEIYTCYASNSAGSIQFAITVIFRERKKPMDSDKEAISYKGVCFTVKLYSNTSLHYQQGK